VVDGPSLSHMDERLGHVAIDMGLLKPDDVSEIHIGVVKSRSGSGAPTSFGETAVELGLLNWRQVSAVEAEERRRRRLIDGYEIIDIIGAGTISTAYHAMQRAMEREVALKILHPRLASDSVFVRAYIAEAQAVSRFHHPNIVQGIDVGESNGFYYFAHEYLSGGSMADQLRDGTKFSENRLLRYLRQTTSALKYAWGVAVHHGDINPGNLLLDGQGTIKLANLGVPRVAEGGEGDVPGFIRCGPEYSAPEQLDNPAMVNARTDVYSLGATFYHISFGAPPFPGQSRDEILAARKTNPMPLFTLKEQENFSGKYLRLIHDMLEIDPKRRPANPEELDSRLESFHIPYADELSGLARQVRQVAGPFGRGRTVVRSNIPASAPHADSGRPFSLRRRTGMLRRDRWTVWLRIAIAALAAFSAFYLLYR